MSRNVLRVGSRIELELVDPERNARRFYSMTVARDPQLRLDGEQPGLVLVVARTHRTTRHRAARAVRGRRRARGAVERAARAKAEEWVLAGAKIVVGE